MPLRQDTPCSIKFNELLASSHGRAALDYLNSSLGDEFSEYEEFDELDSCAEGWQQALDQVERLLAGDLTAAAIEPDPVLEFIADQRLSLMGALCTMTELWNADQRLGFDTWLEPQQR